MIRDPLPKALVAIALVSSTAIAGCGSGGSADDTGTSQTASVNAAPHVNPHPQPSKTEFIEKASAICAAAKERASEEFSTYVSQNTIPASGPGMVAKATDVVNSVFTPVYELQIKKISALGAPQGDTQQINAILVAMQQGIERAERQPLQFIRHNTAMSQASKLAVAYGLTACRTVGS